MTDSLTPAASIAEWQTVLTEITEEMHAAAARTAARCTGNDDFPPRVYRAMLAAAPTAALQTMQPQAEPSDADALKQWAWHWFGPDADEEWIAKALANLPSAALSQTMQSLRSVDQRALEVAASFIQLHAPDSPLYGDLRSIAARIQPAAAGEQAGAVADELLAFVKKIASGEVQDHMLSSLEDEARALYFRAIK